MRGAISEMEPSFDLKQWLRDVDISGADKSLDTEAARLFLLNNALINDETGPILAALIISSDGDCGIDAFRDLARCSDPRLAMMAILNILYVLREDNLEDCEFTIPLRPDDPGGEHLTLCKADMPAECDVRAKIAALMPEMTYVFLEKVSDGDFCCDFLTFLLTILMDLSSAETRSSSEIIDLRRVVPTERFLKAIMRVWKRPEYHQHLTETEGDNSLKLGFLVSCYLKCLSTTATDCYDGLSISDTVSSESDEEAVGISALIAMDEWTIKFIIMRMYDGTSSDHERSYLASVLNECACHSSLFKMKLLRNGGLPMITYVMNKSQYASRDEVCFMSLDESAQMMKAAMPQILLLITLADKVLPKHPKPGEGIWLENRQLVITRDLCQVLAAACRFGLRLVVLGRFGNTSEGHMKRIAVISVVSKLMALVWRAGIAVLFQEYPPSLRALRDACIVLFEAPYETVQEACVQIDSTWEEVSSQSELSTLRIGLKGCRELSRNAVLWDSRREQYTNDSFGTLDRTGGICEACLMAPETDLKACGMCKKVFYCSREDQHAHWKGGHRCECAFLRNCVEGCSFVVEEDGCIHGLVTREVGTQGGRLPFEGVLSGQRKELLALGFRLPGVLVEHLGVETERRYYTASQMLFDIAERSDGSLREVNVRVAATVLGVADWSCMVYNGRDGTEEGFGRLSIVFSGSDDSFSLSATLL